MQIIGLHSYHGTRTSGKSMNFGFPEQRVISPLAEGLLPCQKVARSGDIYLRPIILVCSKFNVTKCEHHNRNLLSRSNFKFTSLQQVTQYNRYIKQGVHSPGKTCLVAILIRVTLTDPELQGFHNYLSNSGFFI